MHKSRGLRISAISAILFAALFIVIVRRSEFSLFAQSTSSSAPVAKDQDLIDAYRHVEVASVSDALEQLTGRRMYMSHKMQPIFPAKFAGFALTVNLQKDEGNKDPAALNGMLAAIDQGALNSVWVMVVEDGVNIAGMGGLMGTAMSSRGYSGAVIDGGVRDLGQLRKIGFPVFALGVVPSTSVHHYRFAGSNVPLVCDGVALQRGLKLLNLFAKAESGLTATQVAKLSALPTSTVHRFLVNLESGGFLNSTSHGTFHLGMACFALGQAALGHLDIRHLSLPYLQELNQKTRETIHLTLLHDLGAVYVEKLDSPEPVRIYSRIGAAVPLHCTAVGKVMLAYMPPEDQ